MAILESSRIAFSEQEMADAFLLFLRSTIGLKGIGPFNGIWREVSCQQGRPDFIAIRKNDGLPDSRLRQYPTGIVGPSVLAKLSTKTPRTLQYLVSHSEFTESSLKKSLRELIALGHVLPADGKGYLLDEDAMQSLVELWAFELKLDNPKRAVFQAQQSRAYANRAVIVVPPGKEKHYVKFAPVLTRWGIGLATFDLFTHDFIFIRRGRSARVTSPQHQLYAMAQMAAIVQAGFPQLDAPHPPPPFPPTAKPHNGLAWDG